MNKRSAFIGERTRTAPVRESSGRIFNIIASLPIAPVLAFGVFFLSSIQVWGPVSLAVQCGLWVLLLLYLLLFEPRKFLSVFKWWPFLLLPALALASVAWSVAPDISVDFGTQLIMTALMGITIAIALTARQFVGAVFMATAMLAVGAFVNPRMGFGSEGPVLIGLVGSKNEAAYAWQLLATAGLAVLIDRGQPVLLRLISLPFLLLALGLLAFGQASGAVISLALAVIVLAGVAMLHLFKLPGRLVILVTMAIMVTPFVAAREEITHQVEIFMQDVLKKDTSLTGRTYLWARADELIKERPILGRGYRATILGNTVEGLGVLRWAGQTDGHGFHFHNTYRDVGVDLGFTGIILFASYLLFSLLSLVKIVIGHPTPAYGFFLALLLVVIAKSFGELVLSQFTLMSIALFSLMVWSFAKPKPDAQWQARVVAPDADFRIRDKQVRISTEPARLAAPIRPR